MPFGWGKKTDDKKSKSSSSSKDKDKLKSLGIDPSLLDDPTDNDDDLGEEFKFDEKEFDLGLGSAKKNFNPNDILKGLNLNDDDVNVDISEAELNDPRLAKELAMLEGGGDMNDDELNDLINGMGTDDVDEGHIKIVETRIEEYKVSAVTLSKNGDKETAKEHLRIFKSLQEQLDLMQSGHNIDMKKVPASPAKPKAAPAKAAPAKQPEPAKPVPAAKPVETPKAAPAPTPAAAPQKVAEPKPQTAAPAPTKPVEAPKATPAPTPAPAKTEPPKQPTPAPVQPAAKPTEAPKQAATAQPQPAAQKPAAIAPKPVSGAAEIASQLELVQTRIKEYKIAALQAKKANDIEKAKEYLLVAKKLEPYLATLQSGKRVNSQDIPQPPGVEKKAAPTAQSHSKDKKPAAPAAAATKPVAAKPAKVDSEGVDTDTWIPVNEIVSNDLFEHEIQVLDKHIATLKAAKKQIPDDLEERKMSLSTSLTILQAKASSGALSMDVYLNDLKKKSAEERNKAKNYLGQGRKDLAVVALQRAKVMEKEIEQTEQQ